MKRALADGECRPQGSIALVRLDRDVLDHLAWKPIDDRHVQRVSSASYARRGGTDVAFTASFRYDGTAGNWPAQSLGAMLDFERRAADSL